MILLPPLHRARATLLVLFMWTPMAEAQDLPAAWYVERLGPGDVLFIDSTHVVRIDGEVPHLVLEVLPAAASVRQERVS